MMTLAALSPVASGDALVSAVAGTDTPCWRLRLEGDSWAALSFAGVALGAGRRFLVSLPLAGASFGFGLPFAALGFAFGFTTSSVGATNVGIVFFGAMVVISTSRNYTQVAVQCAVGP